MDNETFNFADNLIELRKQAQLSQEQLASELFVTRQTISKWEKGGAVPDMNHLLLMTQVFGIGLDELVLGIETQNQGLVKERVTAFLTQDASDKDWHENHRWREWQYGQINNGWEFLVRYYWVVFALVAFIGWMIFTFNGKSMF
ncbi:helix-turn-helix domain-containing protein [Weissella ceti]|uniref:Helix-turn-helix domain-containing protein n=1 Tax=Weissella ceti TaxID=759620 RepID=A0ABT3E653_9LACO|nr:helix-turn-helix transcriptional regulator [Weissella ceti]MCW0953392.1 helix-turn-helix domain-containing protein [Weissella ceti]QVK11996.1 helix-turn-helix transcriptional regulator [Weissella ceti]